MSSRLLLPLTLPQERLAETRELVLSSKRIKAPPVKESFIYALWNSDKLIYIGRSVALRGRISAHAKKLDFTHYSCFRVPEEEVNEIETYLIATLKPPENDAGVTTFLYRRKI